MKSQYSSSITSNNLMAFETVVMALLLPEVVMVSSTFGMVTTRRGYIRFSNDNNFSNIFLSVFFRLVRRITNGSYYFFPSTQSIQRVLRRCHSAEMVDYWLLLLVTRLKRETNRK